MATNQNQENVELNNDDDNSNSNNDNNANNANDTNNANNNNNSSTDTNTNANTDSDSNTNTQSNEKQESEVSVPETFPTANVSVGIGAVQGYRPYMEDRSTVVLGFGREGDNKLPARCFFGVYDGHGGDLASSWCKQKMHFTLARQESFPDDMHKAMTDTIKIVDDEFIAKYPKASRDDGTTVVFAVLCGASNKLWVANAGDSRGIMCRDGEAVALSDDHKPDRPDERKRITDRGGIVQQASLFGRSMGPNRVYTKFRTGGLAVSRGVGDALLKENDLVIPTPEIREFDLTEKDEFLVLASDGLWDVYSNEEVCDFVKKYYAQKNADVTEVADMLVHAAISKGSMDNVTAVIVFLNKSAF